MKTTVELSNLKSEKTVQAMGSTSLYTSLQSWTGIAVKY
jgi:hypothetical protein